MIKLNSLNIAKDNFSKILGHPYDINKLSAYYMYNKQKADTLVLEGEYVGRSYDNLRFIKQIISSQVPKELVKRM